MDWQAFQDYVLLDLNWSPITVDKMTRRLRAIELAGVTLSPLDAAAARDYLRRRIMAGVTTHALNNDVKALNSLHRFHTGADKGPYRKRRGNPSTFKYLTPEEVKRVLQYRHRDPVVERFRRALTLWALKSGMRISEVHAMNLPDLRPKESKFEVRKPAKLGRRRILPIEPWIWSPKRPLGAYLAKRATPPSDPEAVWVLESHGPPRRAPVSELRAALKAVGVSTGVRKLNFIVTRHTRGTELLQRWGDLTKVRDYLGHATIRTTEIYAYSHEEDLFNAMRRRPSRDPYQDLQP